MVKTEDLLGLGMQPAHAERLGDETQSVVATGSTIGEAVDVFGTFVTITSATAASGGVQLPAIENALGRAIKLINDANQGVKVYPQAAEKIGRGAVGIAHSMANYTSAQFAAFDNDTWKKIT